MSGTAWENRYQQRHKSELERFVEKYLVDEVTGCWEWQAAIFANCPYGLFSVDGIPRHAHRVSYRLFIGPIPEGLHIDHLCNNGSCVNPVHLEAVTPDENRRRQIERKTHCVNGHPLSGDNLVLVRRCRVCLNAAKQRHAEKHRKERTAA